MTPFLQMTPLRRLLWLGGLAANKAVEDTASGNPLTFLTDLARPLSRLAASFLPVQSGTGDPSPENVRPITGWTGLNVWHGGKNLFSSQIEQGTIRGSDGTLVTNYTRVRTNDFIFLKAGKYTISLDGAYAVYVLKYDNDETYIPGESGSFMTLPATFTLYGDRKIKFVLRKQDDSANIAPSDVSNVQIEPGQTATAYEAPNITKYPVTWSTHGTVYGGYVDLVTGEVWASYKSIDIGSISWNRSTSYTNPFFYGNISERKKGSVSDFFCDSFAKDVMHTISRLFGNEAEDLSITFASDFGSTQVFIRCDTYISGTDFKTAMEGKYIVYPLATPVLLATNRLTLSRAITLFGRMQTGIVKLRS